MNMPKCLMLPSTTINELGSKVLVCINSCFHYCTSTSAIKKIQLTDIITGRASSFLPWYHIIFKHHDTKAVIAIRAINLIHFCVFLTHKSPQNLTGKKRFHLTCRVMQFIVIGSKLRG